MNRATLEQSLIHLSLRTIAVLAAFISIAQAKPVQCEIVLKNRSQPVAGWLVRADEGRIYLSTSQAGTNARTYVRDSIEAIRFVEPATWGDAESAYAKGDFQEAAAIFGAISNDYKEFASIVDNYGSLAVFKELECYRKAGDYQKLEQRSPLLKEESLSERYHAQLGLFVAWGTLSDLKDSADLDRLDRLMNDYRGNVLTNDQMAQVGYLSGVANEKKGRITEALSDYHRAFTFDYGADQEMAQLAMSAALKLYAADPEIDENRPLLEEAHGLGAIYTLTFGELPTEARRFAEALPEEDIE